MSGRWQRCGVSVGSLEDAYERYADDLVRYATLLVPRSAAADVVADTFADLLSNTDGAWSNAQHPKGFLFGAVANRARMYHRQTARRHQRERQLVVTTPQSCEGDVDDAAYELLEELAALSVQLTSGPTSGNAHSRSMFHRRSGVGPSLARCGGVHYRPHRRPRCRRIQR